MSIPTHIGFIMDGNGRWAKARGLPRTAGHKVGAKVLEPLLEHAFKRGVKFVTLYAFSSENWGRPKDEVDTLINLFREYLSGDIKALKDKGIQIRFIGDKHRFPEDVQEKMTLLEAPLHSPVKGTVILALSYGARADIIHAIQALIKAGKNVEELSEDTFKKYLSTHDIPDPDFIIRTSGEQRLSNFLLWENAYAELYFPTVLWPDFTPAELDKALEVYESRTRRFGKV